MGAQPVEPDDDEVIMRDLQQQADATPRLADGEETTLLEESARGLRASQDRLVAANLGLVIRLAKSRQDRGLSLPDLVQEGTIGLLEAVQNFGGGGHDNFARFAEAKVLEQMDSAIDAEAAAVRDAELLVTAANDYERTELLLRRELKREPKESEIAEKLEWTVERTRYVAQVVADARRRHDEELLAYIDPDAVDVDDTIDGE
jgi:RNA polymerase primary sigma factor